MARDIVVIGASAGGLGALKAIAGALPEDFPAPILVAMHVAAEPPSMLAALLQKATTLTVSTPADRTPIAPGHVYVAPQDRHLLLEPGIARVIHGPRENRHRPAIDPLFRSAACAYGVRVVGVILTGGMDDGVTGLWAVKTSGGASVVQDPADAECPDLPRNVLAAMDVDHCVPLAGIAPLLIALTSPSTAPPVPQPPPAGVQLENAFAFNAGHIEDMPRLGIPATFTCPTCRGALWEIRDGAMLRYRCHTGHAFSLGSLAAEQTEALDVALVSSLRAIEEKAELNRRMLANMSPGSKAMRQRLVSQIEELEGQAATLRKLLPNLTGSTARLLTR